MGEEKVVTEVAKTISNGGSVATKTVNEVVKKKDLESDEWKFVESN